jgi:very-short-patch-repair endonuclease
MRVHQVRDLPTNEEWRADRNLPIDLSISSHAPTPLQLILAAVKWGGKDALASYNSAAIVWRLEGTWSDTPEITTSRRLRSEREVVVHRCSVPPEDRGTLAGIPVTSSALTLLDLCAVRDGEEMEIALYDALRRGLVSLPRLKWTAKTAGGKGRPGTKLFNELLSGAEGSNKTDSSLEDRFLRLVKKFRLPRPVPQFVVMDEDRFVARVDFAYPEKRLVIELVSYRWHSGRPAWRKDIRRQNRMSALGWTVLPFTYDDLVEDPEGVVQRIRYALGI